MSEREMVKVEMRRWRDEGSYERFISRSPLCYRKISCSHRLSVDLHKQNLATFCCSRLVPVGKGEVKP